MYLTYVDHSSKWRRGAGQGGRGSLQLSMAGHSLKERDRTENVLASTVPGAKPLPVHMVKALFN